jgi:hypothetical protein
MSTATAVFSKNPRTQASAHASSQRGPAGRLTPDRSKGGDRAESMETAETAETAEAARHVTPHPLWSLGNIRMDDAPTSSQVAASATTAKRQSSLSPLVYRALQSPGRPIDAGSRSFFERRTGRDYSRVRIHTNDISAQAAGSLSASAYTVGSDIVFNRSKYAPTTPRGQLLLMHELRHVDQQRSAKRVNEPKLDARNSSQELQARSLVDKAPLALSEQRIQCSDDDSVSGIIVNAVGEEVFGTTAWPFLKAVFQGFMGGLTSDIHSGRLEKAKGRLSDLLRPDHALKFYGGYLVGMLLGLISPITDLVTGVIGIIKLSISLLEWMAKWSPVGIAMSPERQAKIARLIAKFQTLQTSFSETLTELFKDPAEAMKKLRSFLDTMMQQALGQARDLGANAAHAIFDFLDEDFYDMGKSIGKVLGTAIVQILLLVFTDAIGNLIKEGAAMLGKVAEFVGTKVGELLQWVQKLASSAIGAIRKAFSGGFKLFEKLGASLGEFFGELLDLATESLGIEARSEALAAEGPGNVPIPNISESRAVTPTRTSPARVEDLTPPKVHPSKAGGVPNKTPELGKAPFDEPLTPSERGLTKDELRKKHILEEQSERQRAASGAAKDEAATGQGRSEVRRPGKSVPTHLERGQFAHEYAELLIDPKELPPGLSAEVTVELPGGKIRLDRVDFDKGVYYEIKPNTALSKDMGANQIKKYAEYMNRNHPLKGGKLWTGTVVTYEQSDAIALFGK